jgi:hypothetical protein
MDECSETLACSGKRNFTCFPFFPSVTVNLGNSGNVWLSGPGAFRPRLELYFSVNVPICGCGRLGKLGMAFGKEIMRIWR